MSITLAQSTEQTALTHLDHIDQLEQLNQTLAPLSAEQRIAWVLQHTTGTPVLSSSFGVQAAVMLHMVTQQAPNIPVILIDTGYLFPETYRFIEQLTDRLQLNLQVYQGAQSAAWQEAIHGKRWEQGEAGIKQYNASNKVEPMQRALSELAANTWFSGIRSGQSQSRANRAIAESSNLRGKQQPILKVHPIIGWTNQQIHHYLSQHQLPYHPLWEQGYVSIGDTHTSRKLEPGMSEEETRFFGITRECGLHEVNDGGGI